MPFANPQVLEDSIATGGGQCQGRTAAAAFLDAVKASGIRRILSTELWVEKPGDPEKLTGTALLLVNPPWNLQPALESMLAFLSAVLARAPGAGFKVSWLVPE